MEIMIDDDNTKYELGIEPGDGVDGTHMYVVLTIDNQEVYEGRLFLGGRMENKKFRNRKNKIIKLLEEVISALRSRPLMGTDADEFDLLGEAKEGLKWLKEAKKKERIV